MSRSVARKVKPAPGFVLDRWLLLALLLLAMGLRFSGLTAQSFWNDEGNTARLVERPLSLIIAGAAGDIHPPGYYVLLHGWRAFAGESEFALRGFSALCGVLTVAVTAAVARRAGGRWAGGGAALFVAVHPLAVYYSQEARMYALLGLVTALTLWAASRPLSKAPAPWIWVVRLALCIALGLYTQYAYILALASLNAAFGLTWLVDFLPGRRRWRTLGAWIAAHALAGVLFAPWAPVALRASGWRPPDLAAEAAAPALARTLVAGVTLPRDALPWWAWGAPLAALLFWAVMNVGRAIPTRRLDSRPIDEASAAASMALLPALLIVAFGLYRPAYLKFLMMSVGPLGVTLALPLRHARWRWAALALLLALLPTQITALHHLYTDPAYARDDYRGIAACIAEQARPGDAVLLSAPNQWEVFTYYYRGPLPVYPAPYRPTQEAARAWIEEIVAEHTRLFVLFWGDTESDPERRIEPLLARLAYKADDRWIGQVRVARYGTGPLPTRPAAPLSARLGEAIRLEGYALPSSSYAAGDVLPVTLFWRAETSPAARYKVFVHLLDANGALVAQTDVEPGGGLWPTNRWPVDERIIDRYGVWLPASLAPGRYTLQAGMYDFGGTRLPITQHGQRGGDALPLTEVEIGH
ncbi:MAG: glycosyltransferase family 39 protein [Anaerolineales bacterium]